MDDDDDGPSSEAPAGLPGWLATFADLMSLLMCFFVLLLAMADTNAAKFKRLAGSMQNAFGVQLLDPVVAVPRGTSIIAQEFSPATPEDTAINRIIQNTEDNQRESLEVKSQDTGSSHSGDTGNSQSQVIVDKLQDLAGETEQEALEIATALHREIQEGKVEVESDGRQIILRLKEHGTFDSGSAELKPAFKPVLAVIHKALAQTQGTYRVEGHTDNEPISTSRFRSNWDLSSARAVSVAHALFADGGLREKNFVVSGFADTRPLEDNDTASGRARNRRVEVVIDQAQNRPRSAPASVASTVTPNEPDERSKPRPPMPSNRFELRPDELF